MNALLPLPEEATPQAANAHDDAYDDSYAWVGYESAQPLSFSSADRAAWTGVAELGAD